VRRLGDHRSDKAYASEKNEGDDVDNEEAYAAKNIGQRHPPRLFMMLQGQLLKLHYDVRDDMRHKCLSRLDYVKSWTYFFLVYNMQPSFI